MIRNLFRCFRTVFKFAAYPATILSLISIINGFTLPLSVIFMQRLLDSFISFLQDNASISTILFNAGVLAVIILFMNHVSFISNTVFISLEKILTENLSCAILNKTLKIKFSCFEDETFHDALKKIKNKPAAKIIALFRSCRALLTDCIKLSGMVFIFLKVSPWLAAGFFAFLILDFLNEIIATKKVQEIYASQVSDERTLEDLSHLLSDKHALVELKIFSAVPFIAQKFKAQYKILLKERISVTLQAYKFNIAGMLLTLVWSFFLLYILIVEITKGNIQVGIFAGLIVSLTEILSLTFNISELFWSLTDKNISIDFLYKFMQLPDDIHFRKIQLPRGENSMNTNTLGIQIKFENVSFTYPKTEIQILHDISFTIEAGSHIALVGKNGSGKTTLIKLIAGLYQPSSGNIYIGGKNINELSQAEIHKAVSIVFQDYANYQMSLRENIALGALEHLHDDEHLKKALSFVSSDACFDNLDLKLGKLDEDGVDFSGGQWQKVAIARACAADSQFIIFDEPTASLDPSAEREMYFNLEKIINNRGCIFISHRLASAKMADEIFVLDKGKIIEMGTHSELMKKKNLYFEMYESQAGWYV